MKLNVNELHFFSFIVCLPTKTYFYKHMTDIFIHSLSKEYFKVSKNVNIKKSMFRYFYQGYSIRQCICQKFLAFQISRYFGLLTVKNLSKIIRTFDRKSMSKPKPKLPEFSEICQKSQNFWHSWHISENSGTFLKLLT